MEQNREIKNRGVFELLKNLSVASKFFFRRKENAIELLDADERVLIGRVAVEELVLNEAVQRAELGDITTQDTEIMHEAQSPPDFALAGQNGEEGLPRGDGVLESAVDEMQTAADKIHKLGVEFELADLGVVEGPHEPIGVVIENLARLGFELAISNDEPIEFLRLLSNAKEAENACGAGIGNGLHFPEGRLGHQVDRPRMAIVIAHEGLDLAENVFWGVAEFIGHPPLELEGEDIG